jgi:hypothetical protein
MMSVCAGIRIRPLPAVGIARGDTGLIWIEMRSVLSDAVQSLDIDQRELVSEGCCLFAPSNKRSVCACERASVELDLSGGLLIICYF